ncbi:MAG: hypothetical protein LBP51_04165 [Deferribacteraceae bacterium]|jgi:hypothetical protein|nr:hypothetical protein [Deferribacteraceae bacterium]
MWKHKNCGGEVIYARLIEYEPLPPKPKDAYEFEDYYCRGCGCYLSGDINEFATWEEKTDAQPQV